MTLRQRWQQCMQWANAHRAGIWTGICVVSFVSLIIILFTSMGGCGGSVVLPPAKEEKKAPAPVETGTEKAAKEKAADEAELAKKKKAKELKHLLWEEVTLREELAKLVKQYDLLWLQRRDRLIRESFPKIIAKEEKIQKTAGFGKLNLKEKIAELENAIETLRDEALIAQLKATNDAKEKATNNAKEKAADAVLKTKEKADAKAAEDAEAKRLADLAAKKATEDAEVRRKAEDLEAQKRAQITKEALIAQFNLELDVSFAVRKAVFYDQTREQRRRAMEADIARGRNAVTAHITPIRKVRVEVTAADPEWEKGTGPRWVDRLEGGNTVGHTKIVYLSEPEKLQRRERFEKAEKGRLESFLTAEQNYRKTLFDQGVAIIAARVGMANINKGVGR